MDSMIVQLFSEQIHSQKHVLLFITVFFGGIISSLSPCTLGLLPVIIGYVAGYSENKSRKTIIQIAFFVTGLSLTLTTMGIIAAIAGKALGFYASPVWALVMGSLILIMGLSLLGVLEIPVPSLVKQMPQNTGNSLVIYPLIIGGAFAFASSPCSTPILAGIMAYTSLKSNILLGALLLFFFSLGQGVILIIAGMFTSLFKKILHIRTFSGYFLKFSGIILILASIFVFSRVFGII